MAFFLNKDPKCGFDSGPKGARPWQMVPCGGARGLKLIGGKGLSIEIRPYLGGAGAVDGLTYTETELYGTTDREIWLQGRAPGRYIVDAVSSSSGAAVATIEAEVFRERIVRIAYYFLPGVEQWTIGPIHDAANNILFPQAAVRLINLGTWGSPPGYHLDLPPLEVDLQNQKHRLELERFGGHENAVKVYFCLALRKDGPRDRKTGQNWGEKVVINTSLRVQAELKAISHTLAHEVCHVISNDNGEEVHDGKPTDLMFAITKNANAIEIRRDRCRRIFRPT